MRKILGVGGAVIGLVLISAAQAAAQAGKFNDEWSATADCGGTAVDYTTTSWGTYVFKGGDGSRYSASSHNTTVWTNTATGKVVTAYQNMSSNGDVTVDADGQTYIALLAGATRFVDADGRTIASTAGSTKSTLVLDANGYYVSSDLDQHGRQEWVDFCQLLS
ncbi:MAG: hypothetical protein LLG14_23915 [Nocardiaceae bacterium]|nr:hypothetical protein [Nocardiaceae bacterium]